MSDKLSTLTAKADRVRELEVEIADAEEKVKRLKEELNHLQSTVLPDLLNELQMPSFRLDGRGNLPAIEVTRKVYAAAGVPVGWAEDRREAAFAEIERAGGSALVKATITVELPKGRLDVAQKIFAALEEYHPTIRKEVNAKSLSTWLKELALAGKKLPDLEKIGGRIGTTTEVKKVK